MEERILVNAKNKVGRRKKSTENREK